MGERTDYIDFLLQQGRIKDPNVGSYLHSYAEYLDYGNTFSNVGEIIDWVNSVRVAFADHDAYLSVYNMMLGLPYNPLPDNIGQAFITNEDYYYGLVDIRVVDALYQGPFEDLSFAANGPPGVSNLIQQAVQGALASRGAKLLSIDFLETETKRLWNVPLYANYKVRVFYHGSPFDPLTVFAVLAILVTVMVIVVAWRVGSAYDARQDTKQTEMTTQALNTMAKRATDPNTPPEERTILLGIIKEGYTEVMKALGVPKPIGDTLAGYKNLLVAGLVGVGAIMVLPSLLQSLKKTGNKPL